MSKYQELIDALKAGPTSALFTHPRDCNAWKENEQFALACQPDTIRSLLADLERAEKALKDVESVMYMDDAGQVRLGRSFDETAFYAALSQLKGVQ